MNTGSGRVPHSRTSIFRTPSRVSFVDRFAARRKDADQLLTADQDVLAWKPRRVVVEVLLIELQFVGEQRPWLSLGVSRWHWVPSKQ